MNKSDKEPTSLEVLMQEFDDDLEAACEVASDLMGEIPFQNIPTNEDLAGESRTMMAAIEKKLGFNFTDNKAKPIRQYLTQGTVGEPSEGEITVSVFKTKKKGIYIGKWEYANGDVGWTIRALDVDE